MNWLILIPVGILLLTLIIFLVWRNWKDERKFEEQVNMDFPDATRKGQDADAEHILK